MKAIIKPFHCQGKISAIPSKSAAHRALICAATADGPSRIRLDRSSQDIDATVEALISLGAAIQRDPQGFDVMPIPHQYNRHTIEENPLGRPGQNDPGQAVFPLVNARESGSTLRFLLPVAAVNFATVGFIGEGRLPERPIGPLMAAMAANGAKFSADQLPLTIQGPMTGTAYHLPGDISSQFISGLLLAAPGLKNTVEIHLNSTLESKDYVNITLDVMKRFGVLVNRTTDGYEVPSGQHFGARDYAVEGDWSNAAFFLAGGALKGDITMTGLNINSVQGDRGILAVLKDFGATIEIRQSSGSNERIESTAGSSASKAEMIHPIETNQHIEMDHMFRTYYQDESDLDVDNNLDVENNLDVGSDPKLMAEIGNDGIVDIRITAGTRRNIDVDLSVMPDALPILAVLAASVDGGVSRFTNGRRLRLKESDRLQSVATMIQSLGGVVRELEDGLEVMGTGGLTGGTTASFGDHRLAMAAAMAAIIAKGPVVIEEPWVVEKSYPDFYKDLEKIGGRGNV